MGTKYQIKFKNSGDPADGGQSYNTVDAAVVAARKAMERHGHSAVLVVDVTHDAVIKTVSLNSLDETVFYCRSCNEEILECHLGPPSYSRWYACPLCGRRVYKTRVPAKERYRVCHPKNVIRGVDGRVRRLRVIPAAFATWRAARDAAIDLMVNGNVRPDRVLVVDEERDRTVLDLLREYYVDEKPPKEYPAVVKPASATPRFEKAFCSRCGSDNDDETFWADRGGYARLCDNCFAAWNKGAEDQFATWNKGPVPDAPPTDETLASFQDYYGVDKKPDDENGPGAVKKMERRLRFGNGMPHNL